MESSDEDEKFLYGSDNEDPLVTNQKLQKIDHTNKDESSRGIPNTNMDSNVTKKDDDEENDMDEEMGNEEDTEDEDEENDDDEYNVEFIISLGPDTSRLDSRSKNIAGSQTTANETISVVTTESTDVSGKTSEMDITTSGTMNMKEKNMDGTGKPVNIEAGSIDLDKDGLFDGRPITEIDPEVLKEKPWRQPGANISDYFNFGFNEFTWTEYLHRQERLRDVYNPRRILMGLLTLQQQGKLDIKTNFDPNKNTNSSISANNTTNNITANSNANINNSNKTNIINTGMNNPTMLNTAPPGIPQAFPTMPMFGGFPPFGMPGMLPINPQANMRNNSNNTTTTTTTTNNTTNTANSNARSQQR